MPFDRDALRKAADQANQRIKARAPAGVAALLAGLHKGPLSAFVTVESVALPPVPEVKDGHWTVVALLSMPAGPGKGLLPPWGYVRWNADGTVADTVRLAERPDTGPLASPHDPAAWARLVAALDRVIRGPTDADLAPLKASYAGILPDGVVGLLHAVAPGTRGWL